MNTISDGQLYRYPKNVINMDNPVKENDDTWDCIRYFLHSWTRGQVKHYMPKRYVEDKLYTPKVLDLNEFRWGA